MSLPNVPLPRKTIDVAGESLEIRGLSRAAAMRLASFSEDPDAAEAFIIARATGCSEEEAAAWREVTDVDTVGLVVDAAIEISGLAEEAQKSS